MRETTIARCPSAGRVAMDELGVRDANFTPTARAAHFTRQIGARSIIRHSRNTVARKLWRITRIPLDRLLLDVRADTQGLRFVAIIPVGLTLHVARLDTPSRSHSLLKTY